MNINIFKTTTHENTMNAFEALINAICDEYKDTVELSAKLNECGGQKKLYEHILNANVLDVEDPSNYKGLNPLDALTDFILYENVWWGYLNMSSANIRHYHYNQPTVGDMVDALLKLPQDIPFYFCGIDTGYLYVDLGNNQYCSIDTEYLDEENE